MLRAKESSKRARRVSSLLIRAAKFEERERFLTFILNLRLFLLPTARTITGGARCAGRLRIAPQHPHSHWPGLAAM